jgi:hypothetical protein
MTKIIRIVFLFTIILLFSCEDNKFYTNCEECTSEEPVTAVLRAVLDPYHNSGVLVMVWEGRIEDNILFDSIRVFKSSYERVVPLNRTYTITAKYQIEDKEYTAVDSATPRVKYTEDLCEEPCYYIYDRWYDLELKYTK